MLHNVSYDYLMSPSQNPVLSQLAHFHRTPLLFLVHSICGDASHFLGRIRVVPSWYLDKFLLFTK